MSSGRSSDCPSAERMTFAMKPPGVVLLEPEQAGLYVCGCVRRGTASRLCGRFARGHRRRRLVELRAVALELDLLALERLLLLGCRRGRGLGGLRRLARLRELVLELLVEHLLLGRLLLGSG